MADVKMMCLDGQVGFWKLWFPQPYGFDAEDRKVIALIQRVKIPSRRRRSISHAIDILYVARFFIFNTPFCIFKA